MLKRHEILQGKFIFWGEMLGIKRRKQAKDKHPVIAILQKKKYKKSLNIYTKL